MSSVSFWIRRGGSGRVKGAATRGTTYGRGRMGGRMSGRREKMKAVGRTRRTWYGKEDTCELGGICDRKGGRMAI